MKYKFGFNGESGISFANFKTKSVSQKVLFGVLGILFIIVIIGFSKSLSFGNIVLGIDSEFDGGELMIEKLNFMLKEGESIPVGSVLIIENNGSANEYNFSDFLSSENVTLGNYYVHGSDLSGEGEVYGLIGKIETFPKITFTLNLNYSEEENESIEEGIDEENSSEENSSDEVTDEVIIIEYVEEIEGEVIKDEDFVYTRFGLTGAELVLGSVKIDGEIVSDDLIEIIVEGDEITVKTNYVEEKEGFGEDYLGEEEYEMVIDLTDLELNLIPGEIIIRLKYLDEEILYFIDELIEEIEEVENETNENVTNENKTDEIPIVNVTELENITELENETLNETSNETLDENVSVISFNISQELMDSILTEEEKEILLSKGINVSGMGFEENSSNDRNVLGIEIEDYSIHYTYSKELSLDELLNEKARDVVLFMKDLANIYLV